MSTRQDGLTIMITIKLAENPQHWQTMMKYPALFCPGWRSPMRGWRLSTEAGGKLKTEHNNLSRHSNFIFFLFLLTSTFMQEINDKSSTHDISITYHIFWWQYVTSRKYSLRNITQTDWHQFSSDVVVKLRSFKNALDLKSVIMTRTEFWESRLLFRVWEEGSQYLIEFDCTLCCTGWWRVGGCPLLSLSLVVR